MKHSPLHAAPALLAALLLSQCSPSPENQVFQLSASATSQQDVAIVLQASGALESVESVNITAPQVRYSRKLIEIAPEGAMVAKGDVLSKFDTAQLDDRLEKLRRSGLKAAYKDAELSFDITIKEKEAAWDSQKENLKIAELSHESMKYAAEMEKKKALIRLNQAKADVRIAENRVEQEKQRRDTKLRQIQEQIDENDRLVAETEQWIRDFTILSPVDGLVVYPKIKIEGATRKAQIGDNLYSGQLFLTIPNLRKMMAVVEVDEKDVRRVALGQKARVLLEAFQEVSFTGEVRRFDRIAQIKRTNPYVKVFGVELLINEEDLERLRPGMNARAEIETARYEQAPTLPLDCLVREEGGYFVYCEVKGKIVRSPVEVKDSNAQVAVLGAPLTGRPLRADTNLRAYLKQSATGKARFRIADSNV
jgi:HlyD family secretion protein